MSESNPTPNKQSHHYRPPISAIPFPIGPSKRSHNRERPPSASLRPDYLNTPYQHFLDQLRSEMTDWQDRLHDDRRIT